MRYYLLLTAILTGCTPVPIPESAELSGIKRALSAAGALAKQHDSTHAQLQDQSEKLERIIEKLGEVKAEDEPETPVEIEDEPPAQPVDDRPKLWITYADFNCPPCEKLKADIAAGKLAGFQILYDAEGKGLRNSRPAIRFESETSSTGYAVVYGYTDTILAWLKSKFLAPTVVTITPIEGRILPDTTAVTQTRLTKPVASHNDLVAIHNRLHGGGSWTWPGSTTESLQRHLQTTHGVQINGTAANYRASPVTNQRYHLGTVSHRTTQNRWARNSSRGARTTCPTCPR